jgi:hypothetical protein
MWDAVYMKVKIYEVGRESGEGFKRGNIPYIYGGGNAKYALLKCLSTKK